MPLGIALRAPWQESGLTGCERDPSASINYLYWFLMPRITLKLKQICESNSYLYSFSEVTREKSIRAKAGRSGMLRREKPMPSQVPTQTTQF